MKRARPDSEPEAGTGSNPETDTCAAPESKVDTGSEPESKPEPPPAKKQAENPEADTGAAPEPEAEPPPPKKPGKKRDNKLYIYGNYRLYYGYRLEKGKEDARLAVFKKEWFEGKDCLDIGCNQGLITLAVAKKFSCRSILGVDIDRDLIGDAYQSLQKMAKGSIKLTKGSNVSNVNCRNPEACRASDKEISNLSSDTPREDSLLNRVSFRAENFVEGFHGWKKYDTILCLSVTKWIHLNWGDDGLITFFVKIWQCLRPGGLLLLEPQPWSSYTRKRKVSAITSENYWSLLFRPYHFREILLDKIGFRSAEIVTKGLADSAKGFDRPIIAFYK